MERNFLNAAKSIARRLQSEFDHPWQDIDVRDNDALSAFMSEELSGQCDYMGSFVGEPDNSHIYKKVGDIVRSRRLQPGKKSINLREDDDYIAEFGYPEPENHDQTWQHLKYAQVGAALIEMAAARICPIEGYSDLRNFYAFSSGGGITFYALEPGKVGFQRIADQLDPLHVIITRTGGNGWRKLGPDRGEAYLYESPPDGRYDVSDMLYQFGRAFSPRFNDYLGKGEVGPDIRKYSDEQQRLILAYKYFFLIGGVDGQYSDLLTKYKIYDRTKTAALKQELLEGMTAQDIKWVIEIPKDSGKILLGPEGLDVNLRSLDGPRLG